MAVDGRFASPRMKWLLMMGRKIRRILVDTYRLDPLHDEISIVIPFRVWEILPEDAGAYLVIERADVIEEVSDVFFIDMQKI